MSERMDLNHRPPEPHSGALPDYATPRCVKLQPVPNTNKIKTDQIDHLILILYPLHF